ncbi:hypothetical protein EHI8A_049480 [Entamoeba histolytica HM-1:IMSS-B]|uniref:Ricin B lectin domain-containing protein n=8 Tax=Entamoeba TaxID=5758 RepID=C4M581_ENTH1|nr:hypothetical protein ENU1_144180 [Entamoeba nuttalli P19]XP_650086.1 uncharacterized protein EHI_111830 [Entamoeba histolytica HM-1:IMSS]EMD45860.1 Hypothetical protein EHI5A_034430 [Entamoeba histolytica KU27]EMH75964.1 hypothetical protein EHI8A_049480 [Entamoeba histolytica HM-1:IMSS-B]EMS14979.1 hypothetical protein KM1_055530 [Entamoeba histolytica HM-3:IMSS]ENY62372.1 hypothetical protein EHI7A_071250 [Entamoeba histolytica HM-1:IMSS-A]GAT96568.1 hypothetical protein conserved domain|eukprot:XP_008858641.1 hypothetical protein ENU1_144180 [Entamoeba nuttalli P19]
MNKKPPVYQIKSAGCKQYVVDIGEDNELIISSMRRKSQLFLLIDGRIINSQTGKVLSVHNDGSGRLEIVQKEKALTEDELWIVEENNREGSIIYNKKYSNRCITVEEGVYCDDSSLILEPYDGSKNQRFWFHCKKRKN